MIYICLDWHDILILLVLKFISNIFYAIIFLLEGDRGG